jgi:class 3 adenylate cyclase
MADVPPLYVRPPNLDWLPQVEELPRRRTFSPALQYSTVDVPPPLAPPAPPQATIETQRRVLELQEAVLQLQSEASESAQKVLELEAKHAELKTARELAFLETRVHPDAVRALTTNDQLRDQLLGSPPEHGKVPRPRTSPMWVVSVDIRRSTELMLKARSPEAFAEFITTLSNKLMKCVQWGGGIVDKFTGDGILAFFPDFFCGPDAGYLAVETARECHDEFAAHYRNSRNSFQSVRLDTGLGIGVDYGTCALVNVNDALTVVGAPVVYACRLSGAPVGKTYVNQTAYEALQATCPRAFKLTETTIDIKHEGLTLAYDAVLGEPYGATAPEWWDRTPRRRRSR